jgi:hypothetical protein
VCVCGGACVRACGGACARRGRWVDHVPRR